MSSPRTLRRQLEDLLIHPAVSILLAVLGLAFFGLGEAVVHPVRARVEAEKRKLLDRTAQVKALQQRYTQAERMDVETQMEGARRAMPVGLRGLREQVMGEFSDYFKKNGWGGRLIPSPVETPNPVLPELQVLRLRMEAQTPRRFAEDVRDGAEGRVARLLRAIDRLPYPHLVTRMEMGMGGRDRDQQLFLEILFFQLP
jgi:hypothetical protein